MRFVNETSDLLELRWEEEKPHGDRQLEASFWLEPGNWAEMPVIASHLVIVSRGQPGKQLASRDLA